MDASGTTVELARAIRTDVITMTSRAKASHVGSGLSIADIVAVLYGAVLRHDPSDPSLPQRDRLILSKGHAGAAVYAALAESGYFATSRLQEHCADGFTLCGHLSHVGVPGVEFSTGSLGHGLSVASGLALAAKRRGDGSRVFAILSDGECDEGSTWEAAMFAAHHKLSGLVAVVDYNHLQSLTTISETLELEPFGDKWRAFGWSVREIDGHDHVALTAALSAAPVAEGKPLCVLAHTVKGKGVSFMENSVKWHYHHALGDELEAALAEVQAGAGPA